MPEERLRYEACNFGYGRRICPAFPQTAPADAVRFTSLDGKLIYVYERDHSPVEYGEAGPETPGLLGLQARAFRGSSAVPKAAS